MTGKVWRLPEFVLVGLGIAALMPLFASVTIGAWVEVALKHLGLETIPGWILGAAGVGGYIGLGVVGPAWGGAALIGWPGAIIGPLVVLGLISRLGRW